MIRRPCTPPRSLNPQFSCSATSGRKRTCVGLPRAPTWPPSISAVLPSGEERPSSKSKSSLITECNSSIFHPARGKFKSLIFFFSPRSIFISFLPLFFLSLFFSLSYHPSFLVSISVFIFLLLIFFCLSLTFTSTVFQHSHFRLSYHFFYFSFCIIFLPTLS